MPACFSRLGAHCWRQCLECCLYCTLIHSLSLNLLVLLLSEQNVLLAFIVVTLLANIYHFIPLKYSFLPCCIQTPLLLSVNIMVICNSCLTGLADWHKVTHAWTNTWRSCWAHQLIEQLTAMCLCVCECVYVCVSVYSQMKQLLSSPIEWKLTLLDKAAWLI